MRRFLFSALLVAAGCDCGGGDIVQRAEINVTFEPESLDFGNVAIGASRTFSVRFTNRGATVVAIGPASVEEGAFAIGGGRPVDLPPSGTIDLPVTFSPPAVGDFTGTLAVTVEGRDGPAEIALAGKGTIPQIDLDLGPDRCGGSASSVSFGRSPVGQPVDRTLTIRSTGSEPVMVGAISMAPGSPEFSVVNAPSGQALGPGGSAQVVLRYHPADQGADSGTLVIATDTDSGNIEVSLCGEGTQPALCATPVPLDLGSVIVGQTTRGTLHVENCGTEDVPLATVAISSDAQHPSSPGFALVTTMWPQVLTPGSAVDLEVSFTAATVAPASGYLKVGESAYFPVMALGVEDCELTVTPPVLEFYNVPSGAAADRSVLVSNDTRTACTIQRVEITRGAAVFSVNSPPALPHLLNPGDSIVVSVHYAPAAAGQPEMGQLDVGGGRSVKHVPLNGNSPAGSDCRLQALPDLLTFGVVPIGQSVSRSLTLTNVSSVTPCRLNGAMVDASSAPGFTVPAVPPTIDPLQNARVTVTFQPTAAGEARGRIHFASNDPRSPTDVAVFATVPPPGICVAPRVLSFGQVQTSRDIPFNITACGPQAVTVTGLPFTQPDAQFSLVSPPQIPFTLQAGATQAISVRYTPSPRSMGARAVVTVNSSDAMDPAIPVMLDGGPAIVPPSAGQYLYYWSVPPGSLGDQGDVFRLPLQGGMTSQPYWGSSTGQNCSGCHALSRDGKYLALIDYSFVPGIRIIDTARNMELGVRFRAPQAFLTSWRPDSATNPAYQFAYDDGTRVQIASIAGNIRTLQGTESPNEVNRMPNWGPNGKIAFVRGQTDFLAPGGFGMSGTSDVMIVDEGGGTPVRLNGASQNGMLNFYPSYSPDGRWIAITVSRSGRTYAAADAQIRLVAADNSGTVRMLSMANGSAGGTSFPTWSHDGSLLSFSSNRPGGQGDWDIWYVPIDSATGMETSAPVNLSQASTSGFDHVARWSP